MRFYDAGKPAASGNDRSWSKINMEGFSVSSNYFPYREISCKVRPLQNACVGIHKKDETHPPLHWLG